MNYQCLGASLKNNCEPYPNLAQRLATFVSLMKKIDPIFSNWSLFVGENELKDAGACADLIQSSLDFWKREAADQDDGWFVSYVDIVCNTDGKISTPDDFCINHAQTVGVHPYITIFTSRHDHPNPLFERYDFLRQIALNVCSCFDVDHLSIGPSTLDTNFCVPVGEKLPISAGSMIVLNAERAAQITPPPAVIVEQWDGGALFLAVTDQTFDVKNPEHITICRDIMESIAPINKW